MNDIKRTFTLVELLVTIAIIAILASLLFPSLGKVREAGRGVKCLNNMKNIGYGLGNYVGDYNSFLPPSTAMNSGFITAAWAVQIRNYVGISGSAVPSLTTQNEVLPERKSPDGIFLCPSSKLALDAGSVMRHSYQPTFCAHNEVIANNPLRQGGFQFWNAAAPTDGRLRAKSIIKIPTNSVLIIEKSLETRPTGFPYDYNSPSYCNSILYPEWASYYNHNGNANFLFADMHVSNFRRGTLFDENWIPVK